MKEKDHYSNKGGHKERSEHWKQVRKLEKTGKATMLRSKFVVECLINQKLAVNEGT